MGIDLDLLDLRCLRAVADTGSITQAASRLGYSQPAVTQRLRRAETLLGQPLVLRSGRGVVLTEAGRRLAQHAVHVQAALDAAEQDLDDLAGGASGTLRLAGFPSSSPTIVPLLLSSLRESHPGVVVTYVEVEPPEALAMLREGVVDLALTFAYPGSGPISDDSGLVETPLFRDTMLLVSPAGSAESPSTEVDLAEFAHARFIGGCPRCRGHLLASCRAAGFDPDIVLETDNSLAVTGLVAAGLGVALLPSLALVPAAPPAGVDVRPMPSDDDRIVQIARVSGADRVPAVRAAIRVLSSLDPAPLGLRPFARTTPATRAAAGPTPGSVVDEGAPEPTGVGAAG